ncbi:MAG: hypothetical protein ACT6TH_14570 [Brevundimonas sp.]|uniref:hypothetical protein n=1 Tax=Brevundimonas sp. TaxID=1871086 RepID=UPI0040335CA6
MPPQSFVNSSRVTAPTNRGVTPEAPVPFWSSASRAYESEWETNRRNARYEATQEERWARHREAERRAGRRLPLSRALSGVAPGSEEQGLLDRILFDPEKINAWIMGRSLLEEDAYEAMLTGEAQRAPEAFAGFESREQMTARLDARFRETRARADHAAGSGIEGAAGSFVGTIGAVMSDPANAAVAIATGGIGASRPLLARMAAQGALGAGQEALDVGDRIADTQYGGPEYTATQAVADIGMGGLGGAGFEALGSGAAAVWRSTARQLERSADPASRGMADQIERLLDDEAVIGGSAPDFDGARVALARGDLPPQIQPERDLDALFEDRSATLRNQRQPGSPGVATGLAAEAEYHGRRIHAGQFDPLTVEADPVRFQYKADGDAEGVTGRLHGVERWDPTASGKAILFEDVDGRVIVADGHQRRGLARRLAEQGWEDARLDGYLFRSADGWTAREVRVVAALKNIREGSGAVLDAAKVFREAPAALRDRSLPVTGEFIQSARQLAGLSDDAFRAVINGVIPERFGAVIGEQASGRPDLHGDLVELLRRGEPRSAEGARALVQEGLLDDFLKSEGRQMDLFGGLPRESTVIARGRIREAVLASLRKDGKLNAALVRNADAIEAGGNVLARTDNEARLAIDRASSELVSRLALRSGEMGEAFAEAAAAVTKGETTPGAAAKGLVQRIRAAVAAGERLDEIRAETIDPSPPSQAALAEAQAFDTPGGAGQRDQIQPKPEDAELEGDDTLGLFDDMPTLVPEERALAVLRACAPGGAA